MEQMTIFDFLEPPEEDDLESMTSADMARVVGQAIGIEFKLSGWRDEYEFKIKKHLTLSIRKSHYSCDTYNRKEGDAFISCGYSYKNGGCGSPIDSIDEAIRFFKKALNQNMEVA